MSKCIVIGDIHGHTSWENIINKESYDKVIFLGDYFDSFSNPKGIDQINNFKNILSLKKKILIKLLFFMETTIIHI